MNTAERIQKEIENEREKGAIIYLPSAIVPESFYRPVMEKIWLTDEDLYCAQKQWRIRYEGLLKLGNAAGIEWSPVDSGRTDNGSDKLYVSFRAVGLIRKADGKLYPTAANYDLDLELVKEELEEQYRQKADSMKNKSQKEKEDYIRYCVTRDWLHKRKHKATLAESGAKARVIRSILGLQSQYSNKNDLIGRPFLMVRFVLDHQNPDIKQAMLSAARDNMSAIYGGHTNSLPAPQPQFESVDEPIDITPKYDDMDPCVIDFENADVQEQCRILKSLCKEKKYSLNDFLTRIKIPLEKLSQEKRIEFFNHLNTL